MKLAGILAACREGLFVQQSAIRSKSSSVCICMPACIAQQCLTCTADVGQTLSVAGSDLSTKFNATRYGDREGIYSYSNTGSCVDIFAPGVDIYAACGGPSTPHYA